MLYPLSPLQHGMLLHALRSPDDGIDIEQVIGSLREDLRIPAFKEAWRQVIERYDALRSAFCPKDQPEPMQRVFPAVDLPFEYEDWRAADPLDQQRRLEAFLECDRERGFDLNVAPLLRLKLFQFGDNEYKLIWTFHHAVLDGRSFVIVLRSVWAIYGSILRGESSRLAAAPRYRDFIEWLGKKDHSASEVYWRETLKGFHAATSIDLAKRHAVRPARHEHALTLSREATAALNARAAAQGFTLNTYVQAAWALLLARYAREEDVVFGAVRACRQFETPGAGEMAGLFINTLPMRARVAPGLLLSDLLKSLRAQQLALRDHEQTPLVEIQRWSGIAPLFRSVIVFEKTALNVSLAAPHFRDFELRERTGFPLTLYCCGGPELSIKIDADENWDPSAIARMAGHLATMLEAMARQGEQAIGCLPMLTSQEREEFAGWNQTERIFSDTRRVHELVQFSANETPENTAVTFENSTLTYRELNERANKLARHLLARGIAPGSLIGLCVERSCEMIVAMLGILKAGAAYVPLDPAYPRERLAHMIDDSGAALVVSQRSLAGDLPAREASVLCIDGHWPEIERECAEDLEIAMPPSSVAYVIYTSGSTGKPKGIEIEHRSVVNFLESMRREPGLSPDDTLLAVTTVSFDIAALEIFLPLSTGAHVLLASREIAADARRLAGLLERATVMQATPATWRMLLQTGWSGNSKLKILCGGEALAPELARLLLSRCGELWNMYGPTETTIWSTCHRIEKGDAPIPVGRPIANTTLHVLGRDRKPQPIDVAGELYIGGAGVARGYHNLPELTREKFVPDLSSAEPGARLYATGDLARFAPDGTIEVIGRIDRQIKIRGFRIEAGEIETRMNEFPGVRQSVVIERDDASAEKIIAAYFVSDSTNVAASELRAFLAERLPGYMIPSAFVALEGMPLTPNGKVDYRALPSPVDFPPDLSADFAPPRDATEEKLAAIWSDVLHRKSVGMHDNFFDLGGHSLVATALAMRVGSAFHVDFPLVKIFEEPTIAGMARAIEQLAPKADAAFSGPRLDPEGACEPFPLTDLQQAYFAGRNEGFDLGNIGLHAYIEFEPEHFDVERANAALRILIARHAMLRTVVRGDGTQQALQRIPGYSIDLVDLKGHPAGKIASALAAERERMSHQFFDLTAWPWFEIRAFHLDGARFRLFISYDAVMVDAWSAYSLTREFAALMAGGAPNWPAIDATFRDYVLAEIASRESDAFERAKEYWTDRLAKLPPSPVLPLAKSPDAIFKPRFVRHSMRLDRDLWMQFKDRSARCGITPGVALIVAFSEILARWSQDPHFTLSLPIFNRASSHPRIHEVIGHFTAISLLEVDLTQPDSFKNHARAIQQRLWSDLDHRAYNGVLVARDLARLRGGARRTAPIVTTNIMLEEGFQSTLPGRVEFALTQTPQVLLDQMVSVSNGELIVWWDAVAELFPGNMLDEMFDSFRDLVSRLAVEEAAWSATGSPVNLPPRRVPPDTCSESGEMLHTLFLKQRAVRRDEPAVITPSRTLSYGELHRRASRIAQSLRESGVSPNSLVAIVMEKGWEQIVATLGVFYSGAAYLPIEAGLPTERLEYLLQHGEVKIALTQSQAAREIDWPENVRCICVDQEGELDADFGAPQETCEDLAYVIYTSGSTGLPKGVMIDHRGAVNTILDLNRRFHVTPSDRVFALSSLSFDLSVYDVFGTLAAGGTIVIPAAEDAFDPAHWAEVIVRERVTIWNSVPALMKLFVDFAGSHPEAAKNKLRLAWLSGDWIPLNLPEQIRAVAPEAELISLGGATEASIWSILFPIQSVDPAWKSIPYGAAMVNQTFHVLDKALNDCPTWSIGELYIGGIGLAKGYWKNPEKTAASFITHPRTGQRLYRTGDLGRWWPDGNIEFLGRTDFQVKIQGLRIELEEIETVLLQHPSVSEAVVASHGERDGPKRLIAYFVSKYAPWPSELRDFLLTKLPKYMVPAAFVPLDALPLTPNGKIDRSALPEPDFFNAAERRAMPQTPLEKELAAIWMQVLGLDRVALHDDFIALGGDSLGGLRVVNCVRELLGERLSPAIIFEAPTIASLAERLEKDYSIKTILLRENAEEKLEEVGIF